MHRGFYVGFVLVPLVLGLFFLIFALSTEHWTSLDYSRIRKLSDSELKSQEELSKNYKIKRVRFEFPRYTSLFGECDEYKQIDVLEPANIERIIFLADNSTQIERFNGLLDMDKDGSENKCMSMEECTELNKFNTDSCFCCDRISKNGANEKCCHLKSKMCDGVTNCKDRSDELNNCPIRKLFYSSQYYDNKSNCLRNQYNLMKFLHNLLNAYVFKPDPELQKTYCLTSLLNSQNYSARIFTLRVLTLLCLFTCIFFSLISMITQLFVICCHNLPSENSTRKRKGSSVDQIQDYANSDNDFDDDQHYLDVNNKNKKRASDSRRLCCKCNCLLCPFAFFTAFSSLAFLSILLGLIVYLFSLCYMKNVNLVYDREFLPDYMTRAYQHNAWLFDIQQFGVSFYAFLIAVFLYTISFVATCVITCRIQMSPAWRTRNTETYDVLGMHDIVFNKKKASVKKSNSYIKLCKENQNSQNSIARLNGGVSINKDNKENNNKDEKEDKKSVKSVKSTNNKSDNNKYVNLTHNVTSNSLKCPEAVPEDDADSYGESQPLNARK